MAYDEDLAAEIRDLLSPQPEVTERKMFGGLAFLVDGKMAIAVSGEGGGFVRVDPDDADELMASTTAVPMEMRGGPMRGWLRIDGAEVSDEALAAWVGRGVATVRALSDP